MQNARNAMNAGVVSAALQTIVYGGAATYGLYNRCASARERAIPRRRRRRRRARAFGTIRARPHTILSASRFAATTTTTTTTRAPMD